MTAFPTEAQSAAFVANHTGNLVAPLIHKKEIQTVNLEANAKR